MEVSTLIMNATERLRERCGDRAKFEARLLLGVVIGTQEPVYSHTQCQITEDQEKQYYQLIDKRISGKPVSRIRGWREFWSLPFKLNHATLDPRPESELLVEKAISYARSEFLSENKKIRLLDLGTGSGCLLLACLKELENATGVGVDISEKAIYQAKENAYTLQLNRRSNFIVSDWFDQIQNSTFDIILCNPPYIPREDEKHLQDEVLLFDPEQALFSEKSGLADYEKIFSNLALHLNSHGIVCLEIGYNQLKRVADIAHLFNLRVCRVFEDLQGIPRCLILCHSNNTVFKKIKKI